MIYIKHLCLIAAFIFLNLGLGKAQQMPVFNHYIYNPLLYNPAATGKDSLGNAFINYRNQWTGINNSPTTATITFDSPLFKNRVGLGGTVYLDQTHIVQRVGASLNYAYHIPFSYLWVWLLVLLINVSILTLVN
jgi:type IX secretion system PorP/SprF family membrane protein